MGGELQLSRTTARSEVKSFFDLNGFTPWGGKQMI